MNRRYYHMNWKIQELNKEKRTCTENFGNRLLKINRNSKSFSPQLKNKL